MNTTVSQASPWLAALSSRDLWHRALGIAAVQGLVSLFAAIDVVFVAALPESRALAASYQVSAALSRAPLFVAGASSIFAVLALVLWLVSRRGKEQPSTT